MAKNTCCWVFAIFAFLFLLGAFYAIAKTTDSGISGSAIETGDPCANACHNKCKEQDAQCAADCLHEECEVPVPQGECFQSITG